MAHESFTLSQTTTATIKFVYVRNTLASIRDELLNYNGAYALDDAVQMDAEYITEALEQDSLSNLTTLLLTELLEHHTDAEIFQFI